MKHPFTLLGIAGIMLLTSSCHDHSAEGHDHKHETAETAHNAEFGEIVMTPDKAQAAGVKTDTVKTTVFHQVIRASGQVLPAQGEETYVVAPVSGTVTFSKKLTEGMPVSEGGSLMELLSRHIAEGDPLQKARVSYETARKEYERMKALLPEKIVSEKEFQQAQQAYETARINYLALRGNETARGLAVKAPQNGYVKSLLVKEGEYVNIGQPLAIVAQSRKLSLRADVPERYYNTLPTITSANFCTPYNNKVYALAELNGRLLSYGKAANTGNYYLPVTFEFDNRGTVVPGSFVEVYLISQPMQDVIAVPRTALTEEQGSFYVYLQEDAECYRKQLVTLGADDGELVQITSGLKPGQRLVTHGAYQVKLAGATGAIPPHTHEH